MISSLNMVEIHLLSKGENRTMKKGILRALLVGVGALILVLALGMTAYAGVNNKVNGREAGDTFNSGKQNGWQYGGKGGNRQQCGDCTGIAGTFEFTPLSQDEIEGLTYMREEEKLARDVYLALYEKWDLPIFKNIAASEQKHMDAVKTLLNRYGITDPVEGNGTGVFDNLQLQSLYNDLTKQGSMSISEALKVGVIIEKTDIDDLEQAVDNTTHNDIARVYGNLLKGSQNHLDAFEANLEKLQ
jgi:hypothetical protein